MSNLEEQVREASMYKFMAQGEAYFPGMHTTTESLDHLAQFGGQLVEGTFVMVIDKITKPRLRVVGFKLVECIVFGEDWVYLTVIKDSQAFFEIELEGPPPVPVESVSVALICNDVPMYVKFLHRAIGHYGITPFIANIPNEICLAYFGNGGLMSDGALKVQSFPAERFSMAYARNQAMAMCSGSHILMVSLDCLLSADQLGDLIQAIPQANGIINFCKPTHPFPGNALILGEREKMVTNGHHEGFRGFFFEDTEYLMNFSRTGTVPHCHFVDFDYTDHPRGATGGWFPQNQKIFEAILKQGHR